ncbi:hypothetical protein [Chondromyces crocatus]|uniref:Uncharacterized protein n=1 Tax=Chondromyces crocatus TaxID=52 RepID=A0A0K1E8S8_CHOCO|nr:hypothetical protein [Chondromyces crocatus]AKT37286.1 uncharacterized protein CMC5_014170 [Chondromyces crocatus]
MNASFRATEATCRAEEVRLHEVAKSRATKRQVAEVALALTAGALATGTAIYAGLDPSPKGTVLVPLSVGAAGAAVPLGVLLATDHGSSAIHEREQRIRDRRLAVRDAYQQLAEARRDRERAVTAVDELTQRSAENKSEDPKAQAMVTALVGERRAEAAYQQQRERDAESALGDALVLLGEVCGRAATTP